MRRPWHVRLPSQPGLHFCRIRNCKPPVAFHRHALSCPSLSRCRARAEKLGNRRPALQRPRLSCLLFGHGDSLALTICPCRLSRLQLFPPLSFETQVSFLRDTDGSQSVTGSNELPAGCAMRSNLLSCSFNTTVLEKVLGKTRVVEHRPINIRRSWSRFAFLILRHGLDCHMHCSDELTKMMAMRPARVNTVE